MTCDCVCGFRIVDYKMSGSLGHFWASSRLISIRKTVLIIELVKNIERFDIDLYNPQTLIFLKNTPEGIGSKRIGSMCFLNSGFKFVHFHPSP